jgi:hypothetical protein
VFEPHTAPRPGRRPATREIFAPPPRRIPTVYFAPGKLSSSNRRMPPERRRARPALHAESRRRHCWRSANESLSPGAGDQRSTLDRPPSHPGGCACAPGLAPAL